MFVNRTRGVVWATVSVLGLSACSTPAQKTDLRPDGPPDLLAVLVMDDAAFGLAESATYCKTGDDFRPGLVGTPDGVQHQICPDDLSMNVPELTDANPSNWYVRLEFDELLDPNIEELVDITDPDTGMPTGVQMGTLKNTQPVTLQCESVNGGTLVDVPYDGYYSPAGNKLTWPVGPSLVIVPSFPARVATQSECQITLKDNITDKDGNKVPTEERGPFKFKVAPVGIVAADTAPADGDMVDAISAGVDVTFNTPIDPASLSFAFAPAPGGDYLNPESDTEFFMAADFEVNATYTWSIPDGTKITDQCGKQTTFTAPSVDDGTQVGFTTNDLTFVGITPFDGQMNAKPSSKIKLAFNQFMDPTTLATGEWSLSPAVTGATAYYDTGYNLIVDAELKPSTAYTFTLNNGATIDDCPGGEFAFGGCGPKSAMGGTFTNSAGDQVVHFTTAALAMTGTTPADNDTVTLDPDVSPSNPVANGVAIDLTFNFDANAASLGAAEWSISPSAGTFTVKNKPIPMQTDPSSVRNVIELASTAAVPPGDYTFTLKGTASIDDMEATPSSFTPGQDVVIHFTVEAATPSAAPACY